MMRGNRPEEEMHLAARHMRRCLYILIFWLCLILFTGPFIDIARATGWNWDRTVSAWEKLWALMQTPQTMLSYWKGWLKLKYSYTLPYTDGIRVFTPWLSVPLVNAVLGCLLFMASNPFKFTRTINGGSRFATMADLKRWRADRDVNFGSKPEKGFKGLRIFLWPLYRWRLLLLPAAALLMPMYPLRGAQDLLDKKGVVLGRFKGKIVRSFQTLSTLVLAAPGSGKTQGVALPTLLSEGMADWSIFIFDIKGELYDDTAGWRSQYGPIFRFDPRGGEGARWNPLSLDKSLPRGKELLEARAEILEHLGLIYGTESDPDDEFNVTGARAAWSALLRLVESTDWKSRRHDIYMDPTILIADWSRFTGIIMPVKWARKLLREEIFPLAEKITDITSEQESYLERLAAGLIPPTGGGDNKHFQDTGRNALIGMMGHTIWKCMERDMEPNFAQLIDAWTSAVMHADAAGQGSNEDDDAVNRMLKDWIDEAVVLGYPRRVHQELTILKAKPGRERGSVLSTADTALNVFKGATVRERTSTSDFSIEDFRGIVGKDGVKRPITFYINIPQDEIKALAPILIMLTETVQARLISQPAKVAKKAIPVLMMLDEFAQIPKMEMLLKGPAVGRGQRVASLLIAQSEGQISEVYGQDGLKQVYDTMEWRLIFPLNDEATAKKISEAVGNETIKVFTGGTSGGGEAQAILNSASNASQSTNWQYQNRPLVSVNDLMSEDVSQKMKGGEHLLLVRRRYHRPILCKTPLAYADKVFSKRLGLPAPPFAHAVGYCGDLAKSLGMEVGKASEEKDFDKRFEDEALSEDELMAEVEAAAQAAEEAKGEKANEAAGPASESSGTNEEAA